MACQYQPRNDNDELYTEARSATVQRKRDGVNGTMSIGQEKDKHAPIETEDGGEEGIGDRRYRDENDASGGGEKADYDLGSQT